MLLIFSHLKVYFGKTRGAGTGGVLYLYPDTSVFLQILQNS